MDVPELGQAASSFPSFIFMSTSNTRVPIDYFGYAIPGGKCDYIWESSNCISGKKTHGIHVMRRGRCDRSPADEN